MSQQQVPNPLEDDDQPPPSKPENAKRLTIRIGIGILTFGLVVTIFGASRLAGGAPSYGSYAGVIHQIGLMVMFVGTIVLLVGYRIPWFARLMEDRSAPRPMYDAASGSPAAVADQAMSGRSEQSGLPLAAGADAQRQPEPWTANFVLLAAFAAIVVVLGVMVLALPVPYAALPVIVTTALAFLACLIGLVYGTSYQRTFCIGAMVTLGLLFAQWWIVLMNSLVNQSYGRMFAYSLSELLSNTTRAMVSASGSLRLYTVVMWASSLVFGAAAVGLRLALEAVNRFASRR